MKVIKFGAAWCPGCIIMKPIWAEIEAEAPWLKTEEYDYDESADKVAEYKIDEKLPTFVFVDEAGVEFLRLQGEISQDRLLETIIENKDK